MFKFIVQIMLFCALQLTVRGQENTRFILIDSLSESFKKFSDIDRIEITRTDLRSVRNSGITFPVFNVFFIPPNNIIESRPCNLCLENASATGGRQLNKLFVSFSVLPDSLNKIRKRQLNSRQILALSPMKLSNFRNEVLDRLRVGFAHPTDLDSFSTKTLNFKIIVKEKGGYCLYDNTTLTEFYRVAKNDGVYYPIDNDNITINPIARPFGRTEFKAIFKDGIQVVSDGFLDESDKTVIDRPRLSNRIYKESFIDSLNATRFWYLPFNTISPIARSKRYFAGIGVFDFNNCFGILGGAYYSYFNKNYKGYMKDESITDESYRDYFIVYKINNINFKDFLKHKGCRSDY